MDADIRPMWPTPIWIGHVDAEALSRLARYADPTIDTDLATHTDALSSTAHLEHAVTAGLDIEPSVLRWHHRLSVWPAGFYLGMTYSHATVRVLVIVASNQPREHPESGAISLHDPRTGAANVALPGLPWGRTTKIPPMAGGAVAIPGWLGCSIAPLRAAHRMTVWTAEALANQP